MPWQQYAHREMHRLLIATRDLNPERQDGAQALFCPYYVPLEGRLGNDWGVIVNPESSKFARLVFEHEDCGCPKSPDESEEGWGRHGDAPQQEGDMWDVEWRHACHEFCDNPCTVPTGTA